MKSPHNSQPCEQHSPGGRRINIQVYDKEKTEKKKSKTASTVLEKRSEKSTGEDVEHLVIQSISHHL